ncbi:MAG: MotA/TolQ/ExbB proton channel family protein [Myxococcales bacterium]|nr:MotA/TolQ/ExbB proton channel family protein [Myxococcales bacterium]
MFDLILGAGIVVQAVLLLLLFLSVASWAIIVFKLREFRAVEAASAGFLDAYLGGSIASAREAARTRENSPLCAVFSGGYEDLRRLHENGTDAGEVEPELLEGAVQRLAWVQTEQAHRLERGLSFLATTGSAAPFIGLFGTVVGIMNAFGEIGTSGSASIAVVAPGIAEALFATAAGLFAAIPAVIAYNYMSARLGRILEQTDSFRGEYAERIRRLALRAA